MKDVVYREMPHTAQKSKTNIPEKLTKSDIEISVYYSVPAWLKL